MRLLRGPNVWARVPVLEVSVAYGSAALIAAELLRVQQDAGCRVSFSRTSGSKAIVEFEDEEIARRALSLVLYGSRDGATEADLRECADDVLLGPNTRALYDAARRRGIPVRRLDRGSLLQLGYGIRQHRLCGAFTEQTSSLGETIGWDKPLAKEILRAVGVPVPEGRRVTDAEDAWTAASEVGGTVVVKPEAANHGRSVFIGISSRADIVAAFESASTAAENPSVLVERFIPGAEHRVLVVDGKVAAAARGDALYVTGDGIRTIAQLMDEVNLDPRRGESAECPLSPVGPDEVTLAILSGQGLAVHSVPPSGTQVLIQRNGNLSTDVTDRIHPGNHEIFALAAQTIGLDIAGIDVVAEDLARPLQEQGGAILEVNSMPGLMMHLHPEHGVRRPVDDIIVAKLFPEGSDGRIPIIAVTAGTAVAQALAAALTQAGVCTGLTCTAGVFVNGRLVRSGNHATSRSAYDLLLHPQIEAMVAETPESAIVEEGLAFDRCDAILGPPHRVLLESLTPAGVVTDSVERALAIARR